MTPMDSRHRDGLRMIAGLPAYEPGLSCSERIRGRCHAALLARRSRAGVAPTPTGTQWWRPVFESAVVAGVCAVYLAEVVRRAVALYGV